MPPCAVLLNQQHCQPPMAVAMIRISLQALAVAGLGAGQAIGLTAEPAEAMVRRAEVVIAVRVAGVGVGRLLELLQGILVLAPLEECHAVGVAAISDEIGAAAGRRQARADQQHGNA